MEAPVGASGGVLPPLPCRDGERRDGTPAFARGSVSLVDRGAVGSCKRRDNRTPWSSRRSGRRPRPRHPPDFLPSLRGPSPRHCGLAARGGGAGPKKSSVASPLRRPGWFEAGPREDGRSNSCDPGARRSPGRARRSWRLRGLLPESPGAGTAPPVEAQSFSCGAARRPVECRTGRPPTPSTTSCRHGSRVAPHDTRGSS